MFSVKMKTFSSYSVVSCEAVQLHLAAADSICEVSIRQTLHLVPVHVKIWTSEDTQEAGAEADFLRFQMLYFSIYYVYSAPLFTCI